MIKPVQPVNANTTPVKPQYTPPKPNKQSGELFKAEFIKHYPL